MQRGNTVLLFYFQIQYAFHELPANVHQVGGSHIDYIQVSEILGISPKFNVYCKSYGLTSKM